MSGRKITVSYVLAAVTAFVTTYVLRRRRRS